MLRSSGSSRGSFHERNRNNLVAYLTSEMRIAEATAHILVNYHNCTTLGEALTLFIVNDGGLYNHVYIPSDGGHVCKVCEEEQAKHQFTDPAGLAKVIDEIGSSHTDRSSFLEQSEEALPSNQLGHKRETCQVCYNQLPENDFVHIETVLHPICLECMNSCIKEEIGNMRVENISCPHCGLKLLPELISEFTDSVTFNKYKVFMRNMEIQRNPNLKWCPNPKCSIVIIIKSNKKNTQCPKCSTSICNKCNREAHPRMSCNSVFQNQIKGWENSSDIQKCKKCKGMVEKVSGCNHMTCTVCGYEWCWLCGGTYSSAHFNVFNPIGCPGLQDRRKSDWGKCRIFLWRFIRIFAFIALIPIILPIAMLVSGPAIVGNFIYHQCNPYNRCCWKFWIGLLAGLIGFILNPFVWIGVICYFVPMGIVYCRNYFRKRREADQYVNQMIKEKLIREAQNVYEENQALS